MNEQLKKIVAMPDVLLMGPVLSPVSQVTYPLYVAVKKIYTNPNNLRILGKELGDTVKAIGGQKIVGCETSGIVLATASAIGCGLPLCYVRKSAAVWPRFGLEGKIEKGEKVVLIDDALVKGDAKLKFISNVEQAGAVVTDIVVMLDVPLFNHSAARKELADKGIKCHYLFTWLEWWQAIVDAGLLSKEMGKIAIDAATDIMKWQGNTKEAQEKWQWFKQVKSSQHGKFL